MASRLRACSRVAAALLAATVPVLTAPDHAHAAIACDRVAAPDGSSGAAGTYEDPLGTPQQLAEALRPGEVGCLREGTYENRDSGYVLRVPHGGTADAPIHIRSYPNERARLRGIVMVPAGADHVTLSHLAIEGTGDRNTVKVYAEDVRLTRNDITNRQRGLSCVMLGSREVEDGGGTAEDVSIRENRFHDCGARANGNKDHAIYAHTVRGGVIKDNEFVNPSAYALQLYPDADSLQVTHNVIDGGDTIRGGIVIGGNSTRASSDNLVEENVIAYPARYGVRVNWGRVAGTGNAVRANCVWGDDVSPVERDAAVSTSGNVEANPRFVGRAARDLRMAPDSRCLSLVGYDTAAKLDGYAIPAP